MNNSASKNMRNAILKNNVKELTNLLKSDVNPNIEIEDNEGIITYPITVASKVGNPEIVKILLNAGADIHKEDEDSYTHPLIEATEHNHNKVVDILINAGANVNVQNFSKYSPLIIAVENNNFEIVKKLLQAGADVNAKNDEDNNALHIALFQENFDMVKLLLEAPGIDLEMPDYSDFTPLMYCAEFGFADIMKILLEKGVNVNQTSNDGSSALLKARCRSEIVKILFEAGANINVKNQDGRTPLLETFSRLEHKKCRDVALFLLDKGANVNEDGNKLFEYALNNNDFDIIKVLIEKGLNLNTISVKNSQPILYAIKSNNYELVKILLKLPGINVNIQEKDTLHTPLYIASKEGHLEIVKELLKAGADINTKKNDGIKPLLIASENGHFEIVKELLKAGADVNAKANNGDTPLCIASYYGQLEMVKALLEAGADINAKRNDGITPLDFASQNGHLEIVKELLKAGADINAKRNNGITPLFIASENGHFEIVKELLKAGADVNAKRNDDYTPLYIASAEGHLETVKILLQAGANVNIKNEKGNTPLIIASVKGHLEIVKELLKAGADVNAKRNDGAIPLIFASQNGHLEVVKTLLQAGADINNKLNDGITCLHLASGEGHNEIVKELLKAGADVNAKRNDGATPLFFASHSGHLEVIKTLLQAGADVNHTINNWVTPLHLASSNKNFEMVKILLDAGATINKKIYNYATPKIKKLMDEYMPKWKGWTRSDAEKFDTIFSTEPDATGKIPANDFACCPVCLKFVERSEACMYMKHDCTKLGGFYHEALYEKYKTPEGFIGWCTICGRPATGHRHHILNRPTDPKGALGPGNGDAFEKDCRISNGGGGLPEKLARFRRMREYAFQIQKLLAKGKTFKEEDILKKMVEAAWLAPPSDNHSLLDNHPLLETIAENKSFNINIPSESFPPNKPTNENEKEKVYNNVKWPNKNNPDAQPILLDPSGNQIIGFNAPGMEENVPVIRFRHRQPDGSIHIHTDEELIGKAGLVDTIAQYATNFADESFGQCFAFPSCKGILYPEELEQFVIKDPANPQGMECLSKELFDKYKLHFNQRFTVKGGYRRKTRKLKKQKGGGGDFFQAATNAVCDLPKKKGGKPHKTKKQKKIVKRKQHTRKRSV